MKTRSIFRFDIIIFSSAVALSVIGILFIYSSGISSDGILQNNEYIKQIFWVCIGVATMVAVSFFDYERLRAMSLYLYVVMILFLVLVLFVGDVINGAKSWLNIKGIGIQPSEFMKIALIVRLAVFFESSKNRYSDFIRFILSFIYTIIPMVLVLLQPDMGTAMVYLPIFLVMAFVAGVKKRYIIFLISCGILAVLGIILPAWDNYIVLNRTVAFTKIFSDKNIILIIVASASAIFLLSGAGYIFLKKKYYYWIAYVVLIIIIVMCMLFGAAGFVKDYQLKRLIVFMDPQIDPQGAGWNVIQSITAVGSGGTSGKGFLQGTQSHYRYLPQQSTDFIFSIIAEEWGFTGSIIIYLLFLIIMIRSLFVLFSAKDQMALYLGSGIVGMIFFHFIVNIGMAMGIMPITGIPLLLVSYGGSSMMTTMAGLGIISSIYLHKYKY